MREKETTTGYRSQATDGRNFPTRLILSILLENSCCTQTTRLCALGFSGLRQRWWRLQTFRCSTGPSWRSPGWAGGCSTANRTSDRPLFVEPACPPDVKPNKQTHAMIITTTRSDLCYGRHSSSVLLFNISGTYRRARLL